MDRFCVNRAREQVAGLPKRRHEIDSDYLLDEYHGPLEYPPPRRVLAGVHVHATVTAADDVRGHRGRDDVRDHQPDAAPFDLVPHQMSRQIASRLALPFRFPAAPVRVIFPLKRPVAMATIKNGRRSPSRCREITELRNAAHFQIPAKAEIHAVPDGHGPDALPFELVDERPARRRARRAAAAVVLLRVRHHRQPIACGGYNHNHVHRAPDRTRDGFAIREQRRQGTRRVFGINFREGKGGRV